MRTLAATRLKSLKSAVVLSGPMNSPLPAPLRPRRVSGTRLGSQADMRVAINVLAAAAGVLVVSATAHAQQTYATASVVARATFTARPSLVVSSSILEFRIGPGETHAEVNVDFTAAMRAHPDAEVVLTVEMRSASSGPRAAGDVDSVTFAGEGTGVQPGVLEPGRAAVAARWSGGGQRRGRLIFTLRASSPGVYHVPVSYLLGTP